VSRLVIEDLRDEFVRRADGLVTLLNHSRSSGTLDRQAASEYCAIQLQDTWTRFCRDLIVGASLGNARFGPSSPRAGQNLAPGALGVLSVGEALAELRRTWKSGSSVQPPWWEPRWFDTGQSTRALNILRPSNRNEIDAALNSSTNPIEDLRPVRNYVAHRGASTAGDIAAVARRSGLAEWRQPADIINHSRAGAIVFDEWVRRFSAVATAAVK